jgi:glycosyltransferase involved in cell wall biosynthesis
MRIGLDARYLYDHFPGIGRYIANLALALGELAHGHTLVLITNPHLPNTRHNLEQLRQMPGIEWAESAVPPFSLAEQIALPRLARQLRLDLLHSPYYIKPYIGLPCPSVVTIYDLLGRRFPATLSRRGRLLYRATMGMAVRSSQAIITISQNAQDELHFSYRIPRERIAITPLATDRSFQPQPAEAIAALRARYSLPERYVLYVGSNKPHKNLERLVRAWERVASTGDPKATLLIAGHYDPHYPEAQQLVRERGLSASVRFMPNVAEAELPTLYSGALFFAFPSYYEGFGLPPLEAMACGAPVLCAYASSLPEVVGNAALTVDPFSFIEMAEGLARLLNNAALRRRLSEQGIARARTFSWRRTALATLRVYEKIGNRE